MCKLFEDNREQLLDLIYKMKEFNEIDIQNKFDRDGMIGDSLNIKEFILSLCNIGLLNNDGYTFRVIPEDKQISNQLFLFETIA